jgi:hypothetical protein
MLLHRVSSSVVEDDAPEAEVAPCHLSLHLVSWLLSLHFVPVA